MEPRHARYPFFEAAREAVAAADVDLGRAVTSMDTVVDRAMARIEGALEHGTVGEPHRRTRVELLSYPVARVLVSLVDEHVLTRKYTRAEARTAHERFQADLTDDGFQSTSRDPLTVDILLAEFDLDGIREAREGYRVDVGTYLSLATDLREEEWRLVNRDLQSGVVPVSEDELLVLVREAARRRIEADLPLSVPDAIRAALTDEADRLRRQLADLDLTRDIDTVVPDLFPPCMEALLDDVQKGNHLEHHSRFAIAAFLTTIGMTTDEIVELFQVNPGFGEDATRYQVDHIRGATSPTEYSPPACATMQSYGDCVNMDDRCETISHPLAYYEGALEDADEDELVDWREGEASES